MHATLYLLRDQGALIPKWQRAFHRGFDGDVSLFEIRVEALNRIARVAKLRAIGSGQVIDGVPDLVNAQVLRLDGSLLIMSGLECIPGPIVDRQYYVSQTWWIELFSGEPVSV